MINDVTDTNVGKMMEKEAIEELRIARESNSLTEYPSNESLGVAIKALKFVGSLKSELESMELEHPYKFFGNPDSYSPYNEGWCDAVDRIQSILDRRDSE